jgi:hypothetical protein
MLLGPSLLLLCNMLQGFLFGPVLHLIRSRGPRTYGVCWFLEGSRSLWQWQVSSVRCAFFDRILHSRMPIAFLSGVSTYLTITIINLCRNAQGETIVRLLSDYISMVGMQWSRPVHHAVIVGASLECAQLARDLNQRMPVVLVTHQNEVPHMAMLVAAGVHVLREVRCLWLEVGFFIRGCDGSELLFERVDDAHRRPDRAFTNPVTSISSPRPRLYSRV